MNNYIDQYCERLAPGLLGEPVNLLTNLAFLVAAWAAWRLAHREQAWTPRVALLTGLVAAIGIGSALFHSFANSWSVWADIVPIGLFQVVFILSYGRRVLRLTRSATGWLLAVFFILSALTAQVPQLLNNSLSYAPSLLVLGLFAWLHLRHALAARTSLITACVLFMGSLAFRTLDISWCETLPLGTHFAWHLLNAIVLYLCMKALILNYRISTSAGSDDVNGAPSPG